MRTSENGKNLHVLMIVQHEEKGITAVLKWQHKILALVAAHSGTCPKYTYAFFSSILLSDAGAC